MDLRLKEITWVRLLSLLLWTILMMLRRAVNQLINLLIEVVERRVFDVSDSEERGREEPYGEATLLPPLSDELVLSRIWPRLHQRVNVSLLWRLRRVSRAWKGKVGTSMEWAALEMVRVDAPGITRYLEMKGERHLTLRERVESELDSLAVLFRECLSDFAPRPRQTLLELVEVKFAETSNRESGVECSPREASSCACKWIDFRGFEEFQNRHRRGYDWSEEEIEAYASSSESSLNAYYPRHFLRV